MESNQSKIKEFIACISSGQISKCIGSNQANFKSQLNSATLRLKQYEHEKNNMLSILHQNSLLIEKMQNQLKEVSDQNNNLMNQQQSLNEEINNLQNQLQYSENRFVHLDLFYEQQVSKFTSDEEDLKAKYNELTNLYNTCIDQFERKQADLNEKLTEAEEDKSILQAKLNSFQEEKENDLKSLKLELQHENELKSTLERNLIEVEKKFKDLQKRLALELDKNKDLPELKNTIKNLKDNQEFQEMENIDKMSKVMSENDSLKGLIEILKQKLSSKENEYDELCLQFKKIAKIGNSIPANTQMQRESPDDPKPLDDSDDSDDSSISFYKKKRKSSSDSDDKNLEGFKSHHSIIGSRKRTMFGISRGNYSLNYLPVEIPESPVVSSSAFQSHEAK